MKSRSRTNRLDPFSLWLVFTVVSGAIMLTVVLLGVFHPQTLVPQLRTGGVIESVPAVIFLGAFLLWLTVIAGKGFSPLFGLYAALNLFFMLEEAEWGYDAVLGFPLWSENGAGIQDAHNIVARWIADFVPQEALSSVSEHTQIQFANALIIFSAAIVAVVYLWGLIALWRWRGQQERGPKKIRTSTLFTFAGLVLLSFGFVDMFHEVLGWIEYVPHWPLEESLEVLGSLALFFAVLAERLAVDDHAM